MKIKDRNQKKSIIFLKSYEKEIYSFLVWLLTKLAARNILTLSKILTISYGNILRYQLSISVRRMLRM